MDAYICGYVRSPFTRAHRGPLKDVRPDDLAGQVAFELLNRTGVDPVALDDVMVGCAYPEGEQGLNIGRIVTHYLKGPPNLPGMTTNRLCGSSMQVMHSAAGMIARGWGDLFLCGGVESMSRIQRGGFNRSPSPFLEEIMPDAYISMGLTAENVAKRHSISRERQEKFALTSHNKAILAKKNGLLGNEIATICSSDVTYGSDIDGCMRESSLESMARLKPAFIEDGVVTAATSSPLTDGASFSLIASQHAIDSHDLKPMARIVSAAVAGVHPDEMGLGPIPATRLALNRAELTVDDLDIIELNEAFSSQSLACIDELNLPMEKINLDGGAIAIGHPLGASGARIMGKSASLLQRTGGRYALATMCVGGGMGIATILERI
ncbi:MAG: thiolase family protein [Candidatus Thermoplasmatota archaeon]|nr:thiolase family protein [Candidatus Thermoplasmatota archaeon]